VKTRGEIRCYSIFKDQNRNMLALNIRIETNKITLINTYASNEDKPIFIP